MKRSQIDYSKIRSFKDFEKERLRGYYELKIAERDLQEQCRVLAFQLHPHKLLNDLIGNMIGPFIGKLRKKIFNSRK